MTIEKLTERLKAQSTIQSVQPEPLEGNTAEWPDAPTYYHQTEVKAKLKFVEAWEWWGGPTACTDEETGDTRPHITAQQLEAYLIECCFMTEQGARRHAYPSNCDGDGCIHVLWMAGAIKPHDDGGWVWVLESEVNQLFNVHLAEESSKRNANLLTG